MQIVFFEMVLICGHPYKKHVGMLMLAHSKWLGVAYCSSVTQTLFSYTKLIIDHGNNLINIFKTYLHFLYIFKPSRNRRNLTEA